MLLIAAKATCCAACEWASSSRSWRLRAISVGDLCAAVPGTDRFGDEVVATGLVGGEAPGGGIVGGDKSTGTPAPEALVQTATDLVSVEPRHFDVEQHAVDIRL